jgi:hydroxymethylpyrimidine pyrophosphatase-like HAD family hydrolase
MTAMTSSTAGPGWARTAGGDDGRRRRERAPRRTQFDRGGGGGASRDHDRIAASVAAGQTLLAGHATVLRSQPHYCDVTPPGIDKGRLVDILAQRLAVSRHEIAVLGDMGNDVEMFRRAGLAIAMGNATPEVKALSQAVTLANDADGFAAAIEQYILDDAA